MRDGWLSLPDVARVCCAGPARVWRIADKGRLAPGAAGDLVLVDPSVTGLLSPERLVCRAPSPYVGIDLAGWPVVTVLAGRVAWRDAAPAGAPAGRPLRFER